METLLSGESRLKLRISPLQNINLESLVERLKNDVQGKWHIDARPGNDGGAGNTLEDLLGVEENNLQLPDFGDIELKTHRKESQSLITLFHKEPLPAASTPLLLESVGWPHSEAGKKYPKNEKSFRSTTRANKYTDRGFTVKLEEERVVFTFEPSKVSKNTPDRTGGHATYGDWLIDVEQRSPHYSQVLPVHWKSSDLEGRIRSKLEQTLYVTHRARKKDGVRSFLYESATLFSGFIPSQIDRLFNAGGLYIDFDARTGHNHGTKLRVDLRSIRELFTDVVEIF